MDYPMQELTSSGGKPNKAIASDTASVEAAIDLFSKGFLMKGRMFEGLAYDFTRCGRDQDSRDLHR